MSNAKTTAANAGNAADLGCQANDLKGLLNAIVNQISDADRRHTDSLMQMQDRLASLGRDAKTLRARVPEHFQPAFERIEAGMADLASRIAEAQQNSGGLDFAASDEPAFQQSSHEPFAQYNTPMPVAEPAAAPVADEAPMALRSAQPNGSPAAQRLPKASDFDTFDVIESLPGDVADPWDREAANALATVYDADPRAYAKDPYAATVGDAPRAYSATAAASGGAAVSSVDQAWLEQRFAEISQRIEASLADIRPDEAFFAIGQRIDQFERSFAQALDNVATRQDVEAVRLIEAHMVELVTHLETTQNHLARIDGIEDRLADIAQRLGEVHAFALAEGEREPMMPTAAPAPHIDVTAVARAAAHEAAMEAAARFSSQPQAPVAVHGLDDMRRLMEQSITNARQSDENTTALLDTLQQAMIRLLDRMDAIEINQHQAAQMGAQHAAERPQPPRFASEPQEFARPQREPELPYPKREAAEASIEEAVQAVAMKSVPQRSSAPAAPQTEPEMQRRERPQPQPADPRSAEKLRQDFIADARRAKMRLSGDEEDAIVLPSPGMREAPAATPKAAPAKGKPAAPQVPTGDGKSTASAVSPRVVALSLALLLAGAAYMLLPVKSSSMQAPAAATSMQQSTTEAEPNETRVTQQQPAGRNASAERSVDAPPPEADFSKPPAAAGTPPAAQFNLHQTEGVIVPGDTATAEARPLHGIALSGGATPSLESLTKAQRDQAMANVSSRLGEVAATNPQVVAPAALDMNSSEAALAPEVMPQRSGSGALDLPPATVGPLSLRLAAANGDPSAQFEVGARLAEGKGTDQSFKDAAKWYQRSASQGFAQAQYRLGTLYERGLGLKADEARAKEWYLRAAEQGNMKAMHNLAVLSANAKSGSPDYTTAAKWFSDAADRGLADSQFNLAVLYENGLGVDTDMRQAYKWLSLAARYGDKEAGRRRDIMKGKLTAAELTEAEAMVKGFRAKQSDALINDARAAGEAWKRNPANGENG